MKLKKNWLSILGKKSTKQRNLTQNLLSSYNEAQNTGETPRRTFNGSVDGD